MGVLFQVGDQGSGWRFFVGRGVWHVPSCRLWLLDKREEPWLRTKHKDGDGRG